MKWMSLFVVMIASCNTRSTLNMDVQGHRGCRGLMPENTIPAFKKALDLGVRTLELDVVVSEDRQLVVSHEPYFNHLISTSPDSTEITAQNEKDQNIFRFPYKKVKQYDVGLKFFDRFPQQEKIAAYKPLLSEVVHESDEHAKTTKRELPYYNIEIKRVKGHDYYYHPPVEEFVDLILAEVERLGIVKRMTLQSFDIETLQLVKKKRPDMMQALLIENSKTIKDNLTELGYTPEIYSCDFSLVTAESVADCRKLGMKVIPWTVNEVSDIERMIFLGVDGIISDYPDRVFAALKSKK